MVFWPKLVYFCLLVLAYKAWYFTYATAKQSLAYQSRVQPPQEGSNSETGRVACVPCRCYCCKGFICFTRTIMYHCFTVALRKRGRQVWLWYQPSNASQRIRLLQSVTPRRISRVFGIFYKIFKHKRITTYPCKTWQVNVIGGFAMKPPCFTYVKSPQKVNCL